MNPLVSVLVITYNQKHLIEETLLSIISQDYENIEILIGDDCSTDSTLEVVRDCMKKTPSHFSYKILESNENLGISGNLNRLIKEASGEYLSFFGGDDIMIRSKISTQVKFMLDNPSCTICYHDMMLFEDDTKKEMYLYSLRHPPQNGGIDELIKFGSFNCGSANLIKMTHKVYCDEKVRYASDWLHFIECLNVNKGEINYINECLGLYRRHSNNITTVRKEKGFLEIFDTLNILKEKFPKKKKLINHVLAEKYFTFSTYLLLSMNIKKSFHFLLKGVLLDITSLFRLIQNGIAYLKVKIIKACKGMR